MLQITHFEVTKLLMYVTKYQCPVIAYNNMYCNTKRFSYNYKRKHRYIEFPVTSFRVLFVLFHANYSCFIVILNDVKTKLHLNLFTHNVTNRAACYRPIGRRTTKNIDLMS